MTDTLFIPDLQPSQKHPTVFSKFDALDTGDSLLIINDHDPSPLYYQMKAERGDVFEWKKVENGPEVWKVEIQKKGSVTPNATLPEAVSQKQDNVFVLNVTQLEPRLKHPTIFQYFDALESGQAFEIKNDHDPKPLYYQLLALRGPVFSWTYLEQGPEWWQVQIKKFAKEETVGEIAAKDFQKAEVLKKYGIDFCCGGKKSVRQACAEKGLDPQVVLTELNASIDAKLARSGHDFNRWQPDFLADYIYNQHHLYYYQERESILELMQKVKSRHGADHPELEALATLVFALEQELNSHFEKEEKVVFPFIKALILAKTTGNFEPLKKQPSLTEPINIMESEHEGAGELLGQMRRLTNNYNAPEGACNSYRFLFQKLNALDEDLHQHIHLENNLLFPKALQVEKQLRG